MTRASLDANLKHALSLGTPIKVFDPATNEVFYLVSAEQYQKLTEQSANDSDPRQFYPRVDRVMADDDAHDPLLDSTNDSRRRCRCRVSV
ncbi:MAG TPA: hypothetical protein VH107_14630 [Lacipirellulaceae bacterium]|jgi:hypothetical protein|nr:hypothetical protein [Lacipirellulaceae bacterium]